MFGSFQIYREDSITSRKNRELIVSKNDSWTLVLLLKELEGQITNRIKKWRKEKEMNEMRRIEKMVITKR